MSIPLTAANWTDMAALLERPGLDVPPRHTIPDSMRGVLNRVRFHASTCRASAYLDLYKACSVIDPTAPDAEDGQIRILLRVMGQALDKQPTFLRPGEQNLSFDESWLIALLQARLDQDDDSFAFLMLRRVALPKRRVFGLLLSGLAEILTQ